MPLRDGVSITRDGKNDPLVISSFFRRESGDDGDEDKNSRDQTQTFLEAVEQKKNIERAREYVAEAARQGAKFICFPETYPGPWKAPLSYSPVKPLEEMASEYGVYIVAGANWPVPGKPDRGYCSEVLIGPKGLIGRYNRTLPKGPWIYKGGRFWDFDYLEDNELPVFDTPFCKVGLLICSEVYVPE